MDRAFFSEQITQLAEAYGRPASADMITGYWRALSDLDASELREAVDRAVRQDREWMPKAGEIRGLARDRVARPQSAKWIDGRQVFLCSDCEDSGTICVWHPATLRAIRSGESFERVPWLTCVVACNCTAGTRWAEPPDMHGKQPRPLPRFDATRMRRPQRIAENGSVDYCDGHNLDVKRDLWEWMEEDADRRSVRSEWRPERSYEEVVSSEGF